MSPSELAFTAATAPVPESVVARTAHASAFALARPVRRHAFAWLVAANSVGVLLATLLLWPEVGDWLQPLSYGRWVPLHLDWQLYGWCALPLVGALLRFTIPAGVSERRARWALAGWSLALCLGGASWLSGHASGKLYLDWRGIALAGFIAALVFLWGVMVLGVAAGVRSGQFRGGGLAARLLLTVGLAIVPAVMVFAAKPGVYPSVNPHSGGATGASLLASTLGIIALFGLLPEFLGLRPRAGTRSPAGWFWTAVTASFVAWAGLDHGNASHRTAGQIAGLAVLLVWLVLLPKYIRPWGWSRASVPWLRAAGVWWTLLVAQGFLAFLPGFSERLKFTNALVSHGHLAMAGLLTAVNMVILQELDPRSGCSSRLAFWLWQGGCAAQVVSLFVLGWFEAADPALVFGASAAMQTAYGLRLVAGSAMLGASISWLRRQWHPITAAGP